MKKRLLIVLIVLIVIPLIVSCKKKPRGDFATLHMAVGNVIVHKEDGTTKKARVDQKLFRGDSIETGSDSSATLTMGETRIEIGPEANMEVKKVISAENRGSADGEIFLSKGFLKIFSTLNKKQGDSFKTETVNLVAAVRGTEYSIRKDTNQTRVECYKGSLEIDDPEGEREALVLKEGEYITVNNDGSVEMGKLGTGKVGPGTGSEAVESKNDPLGSEKLRPEKREPTFSEKPTTGVPSP